MVAGKSVLRVVVGATLALAAGAAPALAQTASSGPYYATPAWDQSLAVSTRFIVLTNFNSQAVLDRETGLVWERAPSTTPVPAVLPPNEFSASYAAGRCLTLKLGGRYGWRVPTIQELETLVDDTQNPVALPAGSPFTGVSGQYWTSTLISAQFVAGDFYTVDFNTGGLPLGLSASPPSFSTIKVWCVRGGSGQAVQ